jgi:hypothetical protein
MRRIKGKIFGKRFKLIVFDLLVILSLLLNVWAITESGRVEGKIDTLGKEMTTLNSTLDGNAPPTCHAQIPTQTPTSKSDLDGDEWQASISTPK